MILTKVALSTTLVHSLYICLTTYQTVRKTHTLRLSPMSSRICVTSSANFVICTSVFLAAKTLMRFCRDVISHFCDTSSVVLLCNVQQNDRSLPRCHTNNDRSLPRCHTNNVKRNTLPGYFYAHSAVQKKF